jgi:MinD superfamily P-loop ATPase containing an inserted ferredoxin domain
MQYLKNVVTLRLDPEQCSGCGVCQMVCPHAVFAIKDGKAHIQDINDCMECGACAINCKSGAVTVKSGVGCAAAVINGILRGTEPSCDCSASDKNCC